MCRQTPTTRFPSTRTARHCRGPCCACVRATPRAGRLTSSPSIICHRWCPSTAATASRLTSCLTSPRSFSVAFCFCLLLLSLVVVCISSCCLVVACEPGRCSVERRREFVLGQTQGGRPDTRQRSTINQPTNTASERALHKRVAFFR